jgi:hypothetical protein
MVRRAAKVDANQTEIVDAFRSMGVSVLITSSAGDGFTDLVIGWGGITVLVEVKDGNKAPSERKLTPKQQDLHTSFLGAITVVENTDQAIELVNRIRLIAGHVNANWQLTGDKEQCRTILQTCCA